MVFGGRRGVLGGVVWRKEGRGGRRNVERGKRVGKEEECGGRRKEGCGGRRVVNGEGLWSEQG